MPVNPSTFSVELVRPVESVSHTGRISALSTSAPARTRFRDIDLDLGRVHVRLVRMDAIRFERSKSFAARLPHRRVLMHLVSGRMVGEFGGIPFRMAAGDSVLHDTTHPGSYECSAGTLLLGLSIAASRPLDGGELPAIAAPPSTPLLEATIAFLRALAADSREDTIGAAEGARLAQVLVGLAQGVIEEHRGAAADTRPGPGMLTG